MAVHPLIIPTYTHQLFDYNMPDGTPYGSIVNVNFRGRNIAAIATNAPRDTTLDSAKIKSINYIYDTPPLTSIYLEFIQFISFYYVVPLGFCAKLTLPNDNLLTPPTPDIFYRVNSAISSDNLTKKRRVIYDFLCNFSSSTKHDLTEQTGISRATINAMIQAEQLVAFTQIKPPPPPPNPDHPSPYILEPDQQQAFDAITHHYNRNQFTPYVLQGVTGSGKTIIYLELVASILRDGKSALILMPEIALSYNFITIFERRFGVKPVIWHSSLTPAQKRLAYYRILHEQNIVIIGARSALFMPIANLGGIIVDEEHDQSYKQESYIRYHARDMAVKRAQLEHIFVLLVSATLSVETQVNIQQNKYIVTSLNKRAMAATKPSITYIDLCKNTPARGQFISPILAQAIQETHNKNEQILLFINRRGYAPIVLCTDCGYKYKCAHCDSHLVDHKKHHKLLCHFCLREYPYPTQCNNCDHDNIISLGIGVERIAEEVEATFPDITYAIVTSDTLNSPKKMQAIMDGIRQNTIHMLIGTQILAKGHHIENLTLVGILDADRIESLHDPRMNERQYQLLQQCAGRAGRAKKQGQVYMQAYNPDPLLLQALQTQNDDIFFQREITARKAFNMPPFGRLIAIIVQSKDEPYCQYICHELKQSYPHIIGTELLGPTPSSIRYINDIFRYRFLLVAPKKSNIQQAIGPWIKAINISSKAQIIIDVDPYSFY